MQYTTLHAAVELQSSNPQLLLGNEVPVTKPDIVKFWLSCTLAAHIWCNTLALRHTIMIIAIVVSATVIVFMCHGSKVARGSGS